MLRPKALDHVGLTVTDMDRSLGFYCGVLGLELLRRSAKDAAGLASAVLKVGDQEINMFSDPAFAPVRRDDNPGRIDHFCLEVESATIDDVVGALHQAGVAIAKGPVRRRDGTSLFVSDPDGCRVELIVKK
jgi:catechol 2,3-dioxygenase-like lactoylglutathione lyase family enzyme